MTESDGTLVARARLGDEVAFGELVARYRRPAYTVALSIVGRHEDAEDVAQESFLVAIERLDDCRKPDRFAGWLLTIVRNRARNLMRKRAVRVTEEIPFDAPAGGLGPEREAELGELREALRRAVGTLSTVQREILLLHDLEGWKHREIAERLELPAGTVRSHLHFARKELRERLRPVHQPEAGGRAG